MLQRILDTAAERTWQVTSVNLDTLTEAGFVKLLADLDYKKDFQIIIDCELERLNSILNLVTHSINHCYISLLLTKDKNQTGVSPWTQYIQYYIYTTLKVHNLLLQILIVSSQMYERTTLYV